MYRVGVLSFDDACKKIERKSLRDEEDLATIRAGAQVCICVVFTHF